MKTIVFHARYATSDFDEGSGPGQLFDDDVRIGVICAYRQVLRHIRKCPKSKSDGPNWRDLRAPVRSSLARISRDYWANYDHDERKKAASVKAEVSKLVKPLASLIAALNKQPSYIRRALHSEAARSNEEFASACHDIYDTALAANKAILEACAFFVEPTYDKNGSGDTRYIHACRDLVKLWEEIFGRRFPRNFKTGKAKDSEMARGIDRVFASPGAAFVHMVLQEIGNGGVSVSQVAEALEALKGGK